MYQVLELNEANTSIPVNYAGKIVHLECYGSEDIKYSVALNKNVSYKRKVEQWFDTFPAAGSTKTVTKAYQFPDDGLILYANGKNQQDIVNSYRNGYWDLSWEFVSQLSGAPEDCRRWTLTNFEYVDGVKTTVKSYTYDDVGTATEEGGIWQPKVYDDYPETLTLTATDQSSIELTLIDEEITVDDVYCTGSEKRIVGYEPVTDTKEIPLIELESADDEAIVDNPTYASCAIYCNIGDVISIDNTEAEILASKILIYIEI